MSKGKFREEVGSLLCSADVITFTRLHDGTGKEGIICSEASNKNILLNNAELTLVATDDREESMVLNYTNLVWLLNEGLGICLGVWSVIIENYTKSSYIETNLDRLGVSVGRFGLYMTTIGCVKRFMLEHDYKKISLKLYKVPDEEYLGDFEYMNIESYQLSETK